MLEGKKQIERTVWAEFKPGFEVEIRYASRDRWAEIAARSQIRRWNGALRAEVSATDPAKFRRHIVEALVVSWRGLTREVLEKLVLLDDYPDEVPFSAADCEWLMEQSAEFENWLCTVAGEAALYNAERRAAEIKNS